MTYEGIWGTNWGQLELSQRGTRVFGKYRGFRNGSISGTAQGNLLLFDWTQEESQQFGAGYFQISPDGQNLEGRWGYQADRTEGGRWWAVRAGGGGS